jgi:hypothetical protein
MPESDPSQLLFLHFLHEISCSQFQDVSYRVSLFTLWQNLLELVAHIVVLTQLERLEMGLLPFRFLIFFLDHFQGFYLVHKAFKFEQVRTLLLKVNEG